MQTTLREAPEKFGLFNNGINVTVSDFSIAGSGTYNLVEPYVVNGCQTTRTVRQRSHFPERDAALAEGLRKAGLPEA